MKKIKLSGILKNKEFLRKIIIALLCILALAVLFISIPKISRQLITEIKNVDSKGATIVCFGDSITFGYGASPGEDYPARLSAIFNMPIVNVGIDGDTSAEALKRIKADVLERNPLLVIIEFGGNDFLRKTPLETTVDNVRQMVDMCHQQGAMVAIVDISAGMFFADYRKAYSKLAKEKGAIFVPSVLNGIITNPQMKSDFLHPNAEGYKIIADRVNKAVSMYLKKNLQNAVSEK